MEMRSSPARSMAPELNDEEGGVPAARGATPSSGEPPGPMHKDRKRVRWLGTDDVAETEGGTTVAAYWRQTRGTGADEMKLVGVLLLWARVLGVIGWVGVAASARPRSDSMSAHARA
jgi:hypothetical protein